MKVIIIASEAVPFAKTGGLADVAGALPKELENLGIEPVLMIPYYRRMINGKCDVKRLRRVKVNMGVTSKTGSLLHRVNGTKIPTYFIGYDAYFNRPKMYQTGGIDFDDNVERFTFFCRAAVEAIRDMEFKPDIIHCNDWQTGLIPKYMKTLFAEDFPNTKSVFTIHNLAYQGNFDKKYFPITGLDWDQFSLEDMEFFGQFSFIKSGIINADVVTTVSEAYAEEIQTPEFGHGMDGILRERKKELYGILNGIDYSLWNPRTDKFIAANYSADEMAGKRECKKQLLKENGLPDDEKPLVGMVTRLADQKGFDIFVEGVDRILGMDCRYVLLGEGDIKYHRLFKEIAERHPKKFKVHLEFNEEMAH
ncbi:MAG: glycogen synthase, partial [bacterium]|nr:glycogen synthase [bacterium]